ncbi:MAG: hypothetical protein ACE5HU_06465 [Acidobacteriota bacterium]
MSMRRVLSVGLLAVAAMAAANQTQRTKLKVDDKAPGFSLVGSDGRTHSLADDLGENVVVLAWFPKAFTGG